MSDRTLNRDLRARLIRPRWWDLAGRRRWRAVKSEPVADVVPDWFAAAASDNLQRRESQR